jgi:hypothetical protein
VQSTAPGISYVAPNSGVITSWSFSAPPEGPNSEALLVLRPTGGNNFTVVAITPTQTVPAGTTGSFAASIPIQAGDVIGSWSAAGYYCGNASVAGSNIAVWEEQPSPPIVGNSYLLGHSDVGLVNLQAQISSVDPVPALSEWGMVLLAASLIFAAFFGLRRVGQ